MERRWYKMIKKLQNLARYDVLTVALLKTRVVSDSTVCREANSKVPAYRVIILLWPLGPSSSRKCIEQVTCIRSLGTNSTTDCEDMKMKTPPSFKTSVIIYMLKRRSIPDVFNLQRKGLFTSSQIFTSRKDVMFQRSNPVSLLDKRKLNVSKR
jgi:hypothetical protein